MGDAADQIRAQAIRAGLARNIAQEQNHSSGEYQEHCRHRSAVNLEVAAGNVLKTQAPLQLWTQDVIHPIVVHCESRNAIILLSAVEHPIPAERVASNFILPRSVLWPELFAQFVGEAELVEVGRGAVGI